MLHWINWIVLLSLEPLAGELKYASVVCFHFKVTTHHLKGENIRILARGAQPTRADYVLKPSQGSVSKPQGWWALILSPSPTTPKGKNYNSRKGGVTTPKGGTIPTPARECSTPKGSGF